MAPAILLLALSGCSKINSDDLDEDVPYYQHYEVLYDGSNSSTQASGAFRVRTATGTGITLGEGSSLRINNNVATKNPVASIIIPTYTWNGSSLADITFELKKESGEIITNSVFTSDIATVAFPGGMPTSFSKNSNMSFNFVGDPGTVEVLLEGKNSIGEDTSYAKEISTNQVFFSVSELSIFATGMIEIHITRHQTKSVPNSDQSAGGIIDIAYSVHNSFTLN